MRRSLLLLLLLLAPPSVGAQAALDVEDVSVAGEDCGEVKVLAQNSSYAIVATVNNTAATNFTGDVQVAFDIQRNGSGEADHDNRTATFTNRTIPAGEGIEVSVERSFSKQGTYTIEVYLPDDYANRFTVFNVDVRDNESCRDTLAEAAIRYSWFMAAFLATLVLILAVFRVRKKGP